MPFTVLLYYIYTDIDTIETQAYQLEIAKKLNLTGRVLVSKEGLNGTLACDQSCNNINEYINIMKKNDRFKNIDFKLSISNVVPFPDLSIRIVNEIVGYGKELQSIDPRKESGIHLSPKDFHQAIINANQNQDNQDTIILDIRNEFEHSIGHFNGAISPEMRISSDFAPWVHKNMSLLKNKKNILMYCTGGVRCEKASSYLIHQVPGINKDNVSQLSGGIHRYLEEFEDGGEFKGKNFVFDARVTVPPPLFDKSLQQQNLSSSSASSSNNEDENDKSEDEINSLSNHKRQKLEIVGKCLLCQASYDEPRGHDVCSVCKAVCIVCDQCRFKNAEVHCGEHRHLSSSYFWFLEKFTKSELKEQLKILNNYLECKEIRNNNTNNDIEDNKYKTVESKEICFDWAKNSKNRRRTLRNQIKRIETQLEILNNKSNSNNKTGDNNNDDNGDDITVKGLVFRKCRWCEKVLTSNWQVESNTKEMASTYTPDLLCNGRCWGFWKAPTLDTEDLTFTGSAEEVS